MMTKKNLHEINKFNKREGSILSLSYGSFVCTALDNFFTLRNPSFFLKTGKKPRKFLFSYNWKSAYSFCKEDKWELIGCNVGQCKFYCVCTPSYKRAS